jgi:PIN domain nuclease of toxin-antitoxin system
LKALLDTHIWLWLVSQPERFSTGVRELLASSENDFQLSTASLWEISIKHSTGKLDLPGDPAALIPDWMRRSRVTALPILQNHALAVDRLPFHHRDPFDRMLIAQSRIEEMPIVTRDPVFDAYDVEVIRA